MAVTEVGLYIGADFADLVVMSFLKGKPQIIKTARSPLFEGQTAGISRVFDAAGQKRSNVNTCLPQGEIMLRRFIMPYLIPQERMTAVKFEAQKYIPFKLDDVISDFYVTSENKVAMSMDVLFAAANKQATEKNLQVFKDLSITLNVLDIMPVALIRVMSLSDKWGSRQESKAVVHVEKDSRGSIIIIKDDQPYLVREIAPSSSKEVFFTNMLNNLRLSVDYFKRETKETGIEKILICGEGDLAGAELYLKENASVDRVEVLELKDEIAGLNELSRKQLIAAGLAMSGFEKPKPKINLLTRVPKAGMPRQIRDYKPLIIEGATLISVLIILNFIMSVTLSYKTRAVNNIKSQRPIVAGVSLDGNLASLADAEKKIGAKLDSLQGLVGKDRVFLTKKLNKLGKIMPESAWIEAFKFSDETGKSRTLNITGMIYSKDRDEAAIANRILSQMKQDPGLSEGFQDIKLSSLKRVSAYGKELAEFSIDCTGSISRFAESAVAYMNAGEF